MYDNTAITPASYNNNNDNNHNRQTAKKSRIIVVIIHHHEKLLSPCFQLIRHSSFSRYQPSIIMYKRYMPPMAMRPIASDPCCKSSSTNHAQALRWFITIPYQQLPPRPAQHFSLKFVAAHTDKPTNRRQLTLTAIMYKMHTQQEEANNNDR